jgi:histidinol-phosphate aminotransferase
MVALAKPHALAVASSDPGDIAHALEGARPRGRAHRRTARELIQLARRVIPPYSLAQPAVEAALRALTPDGVAASAALCTELLIEREYLHKRLVESPLVETVWPSDTNFLMIDCRDAGLFMRRSMAGGSIVRDLRGYPALPASLRISVGTRAQNDALLSSLESR